MRRDANGPRASIDLSALPLPWLDRSGQVAVNFARAALRARPTRASDRSVPMSNESLRTERLILRRWRREDREPFAALNSDPQVMECLPKLLTREESDALAD